MAVPFFLWLYLSVQSTDIIEGLSVKVQFVKTNNNVMFAVIQALLALINEPEPEHPLRAELAEEFMKDYKKFSKNAEEHTKKFSEKRPD